ncbi:MAG: YqaJ viral recombinase family protein, partial [Ruminococcus sp.]|nr:YqaJ viral recombinase family protein [Ruminococcus sp.]
MITKISTKGMSHDQWLEARRKSIGGSDAGAICGMNPYSSAYTVYADKLMLIPPAEDNEAMRQGRDLEEYVARRFCEEKGKRVKRDHSIIYNTDFPYSHADVDRLVVGE